MFNPALHLRLLPLITLLFLTTPAQSSNECHRLVREASLDFLSKKAERLSQRLQAEHYKTAINNLPDRAKQARCHKPLSVMNTTPIQPGKISLRVTCPDTQPWSLFIQGRIEIFIPVATASTNIAKGTVLTDNLITMKSTDIGSLSSDYFTSLPVANSLKTNQKIKAGTVLTTSMISSNR